MLDDNEVEDGNVSENDENDENDEFDLLTDEEIPLVVEQWLWFEVILHYKKSWNC